MTSNKRRISQVLKELQLPETLQQRIHITGNYECCPPVLPENDNASSSSSSSSFVLYLPTVVLRHKHNPALATACHLANKLKLPVLILCVVLDDTHHCRLLLLMQKHNNETTTQPQPQPQQPVVVATARRLVFQLEALQAAVAEWSEWGCQVLIRVHGPDGARTPHHLTLASQAAVTVTDEPFCDPYLSYCKAVERACAAARVPVLRVDGSTTVPPISILRKTTSTTAATTATTATSFQSVVPTKAWMWQKQTAAKLCVHVKAAVEQGALDAPVLLVPVIDAVQLNPWGAANPLAVHFPTVWNESSSSSTTTAAAAAPGKRPWTAADLKAIVPSTWVRTWPGVDQTVPPCIQTHGAHGWKRWKRFQNNSGGLAKYASKRNDIQQPRAVSRLSCYLNLGTISILQIVHELSQDGRNTEKFQEEIIKWREISYAHAFARSDYFGVDAVPSWARTWLQQERRQQQQQPSSRRAVPYTLHQLATFQTNDATWNAMQEYLVKTGELQNNARMTWGKTLVHWQTSLELPELLRQLAFVNDRFALDGLSPPSYAGLLWCVGWGDKPGRGGGISTKPASRYRVGPQGFVVARRRLLEVPEKGHQQQSSVLAFVQPRKKQKRQAKPSPEGGKKTTITAYFQPVGKNGHVGITG